MRIHPKEYARLDRTKNLVRSIYPDFGVNKVQELVRLVYEISKREDIAPAKVLSGLGASDFDRVKNALVMRRYPFCSASGSLTDIYLPKIDLDVRAAADVTPKPFYPKRIYAEQKVADSNMVRRVRKLFPRALFAEIETLKKYLAEAQGHGIADYNNRRDALFFVKEEYDLVKACPCTNGAVGCGYRILNLGFGCIFDCTYCFLQGYTNSPGIILPVNVGSFFDSLVKERRKGVRIGTGEFTDSLALDHITEYSLPIIEFFKTQKETIFEFKTKSSEIRNLLKIEGQKNIVISWSLNPGNIIKDNEFHAASLNARLNSAAKCVKAGYRAAFHFDPVIYFSKWERSYADVVDAIFEKIALRDIAWISIGTFRFAPSLKTCIEKRFPGNTILDEELIPGFDGKLRYPYALRFKIYQVMTGLITRHSPKIPIYLCMEDAKMWSALHLRMPRFT